MNRKPTEVPASLKNVDIKALLRKRGVYLQQKQYVDLMELARPLAKKMLEKKIKTDAPVRRHSQFTNEQLQGYWEKQIHIVEIVEQRFEKKVEQFIIHVEKDFLSHLDAEIGNRKSFVKFIQKDYFDDSEEEWLVQAQIDFAPLLENVAVLAGNQANKLIGIDDPYLPFNYRSQIAKNVENFTKSMLSTDRDSLINLITIGLQDGKSVPEIRTSIEEAFGQYSKNQAQRITRTEVIRASNQASIDAFEQSGVVEGKQWLTAGAVDECADYEGQVVGLREGFYGETDEFADGDPPLHPNCRCVVIPIVEGVKAYRPNNKKMVERIQELEGLLDKRTKEAKELIAQHAEDDIYVKLLEKHLGIDDE